MEATKMLKIKANLLKDFIVKTTANGFIPDCKLRFTSNGLEMGHKDSAGVILIVGVFATTNFAEYEVCDIDVKSTETLIKSLKTFKDNVIQIVKQNNVVKIMDENGSFTLTTAEKVDCYREGGVPGLTYDHNILVKKSIIDSIVEKSSIIKTEDVIVNNVNNKLTFTIGKESDTASMDLMTTVKDSKSATFNLEYFKKLTDHLDTIFDLSIGDGGTPSKFLEKTDKYTVVYFLTPNTVVDETKAK